MTTVIEEKILASMKIPRVRDMNATCSVKNRISEILLKLEITDLNIYIMARRCGYGERVR